MEKSNHSLRGLSIEEVIPSRQSMVQILWSIKTKTIFLHL